MTDRTHPDSGHTTGGIVEMLHARIAELEAQLASIGAGGVSGPLMGRAMDHFRDATKMMGRWYMVTHDGVATLCEDRRDAEKEAKDADMAWPHSGPHRAVQLVDASTAGFTAADMATAEARGFRDGAASAMAGEPMAQADSQSAPTNTRQIAECYGDCPTAPKTCANPCKRLLAASPTPPAEQQVQTGAVGRTGCTAGTDEECTRRGCATSCPAQQAAPKAAPGESTPELQRMTASRAAFFMERFLREEKLLGPNERAAVQFALNMLEAAPQPTPTAQAAPAAGAVAGASEVVAYLDVGAGGYLDLGTDLCEEALQRLPKGRHALVIAGTYGIDGYAAAPTPQSAPAGVLEDAARWHWMAGYIVGTRTDLDDELIASATVNELRKLVDADLAARKQGANHD